jgi:glycosyltransferase involved in cell wall biosynthesis
MISVIVPACDEEAVIARTLRAITTGAGPGELDVIVVCNGCVDKTADVARKFGGPVRVIETSVRNKANALNIGDHAASSFPRVYADADIVITIDVIRALARRLQCGDVFAVAPMAQIDVSGCSWPVRAFFEIRSRLPSAGEGIGGSGVYALSEEGRRRFGPFPSITADDGYVRIHFLKNERETLHKMHSRVFAPRNVSDLITVKTRAHYGSFELASVLPILWCNRGEANNRTIVKLFREPAFWSKLLIYILITQVARHRAAKQFRTKQFVWKRDESSRSAA